MLELKNISKSFKERDIFKNLNYKFNNSGLYLIVGESGSGKTTLLNIISGIEKPDSGQVLYKDKDICSYKEIFSATISYVTQSPNLIFGLTVRQNIKLVGDIPKELLKEVKLNDLIDKKIDDLSNGERQRLSLIMAYLKANHFILIDEPTASLDENNASIISNLIYKMSKSKLVIVTSHNKNLFTPFADYILTINNFTLEEERRDKTNKIYHITDMSFVPIICDELLKFNFNDTCIETNTKVEVIKKETLYQQVFNICKDNINNDIKLIVNNNGEEVISSNEHNKKKILGDCILNLIKNNILKLTIFSFLTSIICLILFVFIDINYFNLVPTTINYLQDKDYEYLPIVRYVSDNSREYKITYGFKLDADYKNKISYIDTYINELPTRIYLNNKNEYNITDFAYENLRDNIKNDIINLNLMLDNDNNIDLSFSINNIIKTNCNVKDYLNKDLSLLDNDMLVEKINYLNIDIKSIYEAFFIKNNIKIPLIETKNLENSLFLPINCHLYNDIDYNNKPLAYHEVIMSNKLYDYLFNEPFSKNKIYNFNIEDLKDNPIYQNLPAFNDIFENGISIVEVVDSSTYDLYFNDGALLDIVTYYTNYLISGYVVENNKENIEKIYDLNDFINLEDLACLKTVNSVLAGDDVAKALPYLIMIAFGVSLFMLLLFSYQIINKERKNIINLKLNGIKSKVILLNYLIIFIFLLLIIFVFGLILDIITNNIINNFLFDLIGDIGVSYLSINYIYIFAIYLILFVITLIAIIYYINYNIKFKISYISKNY